ncbi:DNA polymerase iota isoform X3 [Phyllostomus discolor]|uniref:DNA polymerase iota isoform X3 n=1 Tax=Phyllostomus discolor TaxID=89673 RepID=A0A7E6CGL1_9CHIR|nr:DNA polymerase iota isoform X3 [Phyllostomus discolor]
MERARAGALAGSPVHDQVVPAGSSSSRVIVHVDLDCFYAQVEMISNPELKGKPLGVQQKSLVVTCNYEARELGVKKLMSVRDAKEKCPQLVLVNGEDLTRYRAISYKVTELLEEFSPVVERLGFDENFVDVTEMVEKRLQPLQSDELPALTVSGHVYNDQSINLHDILHRRLLVGSQMAAEMREAMHDRLGLTGCAGVASNKLLAKLVSGVFKPNQQTVLLPESSQDLILSLKHIKEMPGSYDAMTPMVDTIMKLFRNMVNVKMPFHLTLLNVCFCNLKAVNTAKKGTIDYYLTPSLSTMSHPGKRSFKMKETHMEDFSKDKETNWNSLPTGRIESTRAGKSPLDTINFSRGDSDEFPLSSLPEGIDQEVFKQLPVDIQEEILSGKSREKVQGKGSLSCPLRASRGILSFFSTKQIQESPLNPRDHVSNSKQMLSVSPCEPGTSGLNSSSSSHLSSQKDCSHSLDSRLKVEGMSQRPKESQGFCFPNTKPTVSIFHSFPNSQSEQLFSKNLTTDSHKPPTATVPHHEALAENREQGSSAEKVTFPSDVDPEVFYELPEEVQKELVADWKRRGSEFHNVHK